MEFEQLEAAGLIRRTRPSRKRGEQRLALALRDLKTAQGLVETDPDWAFAVAYNSLLQATRSLMAAMGYRENVREAGHVGVVRFAETLLGGEFPEEILLFDSMRRERHHVVYEAAGETDPGHLRKALSFAERFVRVAEERLRGLAGG